METAITWTLDHAGPIGIGLSLLAAYLWTRYVQHLDYAADIEAERQAEHARRASELKQAAKWQQEREARTFRIIKGRRA